jgi:hypothetical protein
LGCYHGINPGMGWLFAVALGLQERSRRALFAALPPIALGHVLSVSAIVAVAGIVSGAIPQLAMRIGAAAILISFGLYRIIRARHFRWAGMRVGFWGLAAWAFLMATGHGAGLMLLPFLIPINSQPVSGMNMPQTPAAPDPALWAAAVGVHTAGYLAAMILVAALVYDRLGVVVLRKAWWNFDLAWAVALIISGLVLLLL